MKALDDIAEEAAEQMRRPLGTVMAYETIRAAIDKALEVVLTKEPSEAMMTAGLDAYCMEGAGFLDFARAMTAALLEEIKGKP